MKKRAWLIAGGLAAVGWMAATAEEVVALSALDLAKMTTGWGEVQARRSVERNPLTLAGQTYEDGVGTHADSALYVELGGDTRTFAAVVGVDDEVKGQKGSVEFLIYGDGRLLWRSGTLRAGGKSKKVDLDLSGVRVAALLVTSGPDGMDYDHADWADAKFTFAGARPRAIDAPREEAVRLTPKAPPAPRINGARVFGVRPTHPFLFTIAASGDRPMTFSADPLPEGLALDPQSGRITGTLAQAGEHRVTLRARNALGEASRELRIVAGDRIALTPPMGWNSWNCFASAVDADKVRAAADAMIEKGLQRHGWTYINIDDFWETHPESQDPTLQGAARDAEGRILTNKRFPDMKGLADYIHGLGLKVGIYSSPGPLTCGGCIASYEHEVQDACSYAEWGMDYLKYDWCSYSRVARGQDLYWCMKPYFVMRDALRAQKRDIVYSLCQYGMGNVSAWGDKVGGNCWRTTGDITDTWGSMSGIGFSQNGLEHFAGPGNWNDPDMLVVGHVGWGPSLHPSRLTPNEQYTHISLWCLLASPLLIGCDMTKLDDFTLGLLTNDEVLEVNQDPLGRQAARVAEEAQTQVWAKRMEDGSVAAGLFNLGEMESEVVARWADLGLAGEARVRDLWRQQDLGTFRDAFKATVGRHGVRFVRIFPPS